MSEQEQEIIKAAQSYVRAKRKVEHFHKLWWGDTETGIGYSTKARRIYYKWDERLSVAEDRLNAAVDAISTT